jgi:hypothetical protein
LGRTLSTVSMAKIGNRRRILGHQNSRILASISASRRRRRAGKIVGTLFGLVLVVLGFAIAAPLLLRGPVARALFAHAFASRCGHFSIRDAHVGWTAVFQLVLGRPVRVTVEGLSIVDPDGKPVFEAGHLDAAVMVALSPMRVTVTDALVAAGRWRLAEGPDGDVSAAAFRPVPSQGRAACAKPAPRRAASSSETGLAVVIQSAHLRGLDVDLDFAEWGLALAQVSTDFSLATDPTLRFDFRNAEASHGNLRVGSAVSEWAAAVPFDRVVINQVGIADTATDLVLDVTSARTGRAELLGQASFRNLFPASTGDSAPAGLDVDARWHSFGGALAKLEAAWRPQGDWGQHLDGELHVGIHGPYSDLRATLAAYGHGSELRADLSHGVASLRFQTDGADTRWMVGPALSPILGGRLTGFLAAEVALSPSLQGMSGDISVADLRLDRSPPSSGPGRIVVRVGPGLRPTAGDSLSLAIERVSLSAGRLRVADAELRWTRLSARADIMVTLAEGKLDVAFPARSSFPFGAGRIFLPRLVTLRWDHRGLSLAPFRLRASDGAYFELSGSLSPEEELAGRIRVHAYPVGSLPGLRDQKVDGKLSGWMVVSGSTVAPSAKGRFRVASLSLRDQPVGAVRAEIHLREGSGRVTARIGDSLAASVKILRQPRWTIAADISLQRQSLGSWLPPPLKAAPIDASGKIHVAYSLGHPLTTNLGVELTGPGLDNFRIVSQSLGQSVTLNLSGQIDVAPWRRLWSRYLADAEGAVSVDFALRYPATESTIDGTVLVARHLKLRLRRRLGLVKLLAGNRLSVDGYTISSRELRVESPWFQGRVSGQTRVNVSDIDQLPLAVSISGDIDMGRLPIRLPTNLSLRGWTSLSADIEGTISAPSIRGEARLHGVTVQAPSLPTVSASGTLSADGHRLATRDLILDIEHLGRIAIGSPASTAWMGWESLNPPRLGNVNVPFSGSHLVVAGPHLPLGIRDLDMEGRLVGRPGALALVADATIAGGTLNVSRARRQTAGTSRRPWYAGLPPGLTIDLRLRGPKQALRVDVPFLPDVTLDFDCHLHATRHSATVSGGVRGDGTYDRTALNLYAWLTAKDPRRCGMED